MNMWDPDNMDEKTRWMTCAAIFIVSLVVIFLPIGVLWVLNTVFGLGTAYTFKSWLAMWLLILVVSSILAVRSR